MLLNKVYLLFLLLILIIQIFDVKNSKNTKKNWKESFRTNKNIPFNSISFHILLIHSTKSFEVFRILLKIESERKFKFFNYLIIPLFYCILWNIFPASIDFKMIIVAFHVENVHFFATQGFLIHGQLETLTFISFSLLFIKQFILQFT